MYNTILIVLISLSVSAIIVNYCLPKILLFSLRRRVLDATNGRKIHTVAASRLGGVAFFPAIIFSLLVAVVLEAVITGGVFDGQIEVLIELFCVLVLYVVGLTDDVVGVGYNTKFIFQFLVSVVIVCTGNFIQGFNGFLGVGLVNPLIAIPLTLVLFVFIINAINLIDGIDGLASMLSIIALSAYGTMFYLNNNYSDSIFCFVAMGALLPFFYHNVFGIRPRIKSKIFMGDGGSLVIGVILAIMSVKLWNVPYIDSVEQSKLSVLSWTISFTMLLIPCFDVVRVVLHRAKIRKPLFMPDKNHFHHKLIACGFTTRQALCVIIGIDISYLIINLELIAVGVDFTFVVLTDILSWTLLHMYITKKIK